MSGASRTEKAKLDPALENDLRARFQRERVAAHYGISLLEVAPGRARVGMTVTEQTRNMFGLVHGAAMFALIDEAFQLASNSHGSLAVALNLSVNFLASPEVGVKLISEAAELSRTRRTATYSITIRDEAGALVASCQALAYRKGTPFVEAAPSPGIVEGGSGTGS